MRTEDLISLMTMDVRPVDLAWLDRATALTGLVALAIGAMLVLATVAPRPDFAMF